MLILLTTTSQEAAAINASPLPVRLRQPDGTEVVLKIKGDPIFNWFEDMEGRTVVRDGKSYVYAQLDAAGWLAPTRLLAGRDDARAAGIRPGVFPTRAAVQAFRQQALVQGMAGASVPGLSPGGPPPQGINPVGTVKNLVVLCRFSDHDDTKIRAREDYDAVFNNVGGHATLAPTGSVKDYFTEASYGTVTLNSTVVAWVTLPNTEAYYANGQNGTSFNYPNNAQRMVYDALNLVDPLVNFGDFDMDNDGFIDAITIIHSGYAAETGGGGGNWIWSHKWALWAVPGGRWTSADLNGSGVNVKVYDYHTEAALWGTSGTGITRIGVICHETGHFFGLPDLYDTDGTSEGIGSYCLMANSWGFDFSQQKPPHFSAWCRQQLGWVTPTVITPGTYTVPRVAVTPTVYKITSGYPDGEYLLVENRQPYGMESIMPQGGLCVWHIDENKSNNTQEGHPWQSGWPANGNHYKVALLQADGLYEMERDMNRGNAGDVYHGGGVSQITPATVPNTDRYQGGVVQVTNNAITGISAAGPSMSFTYSQAPIPAITSALTAEGAITTPFSYQITATNSPTSFSATGLPAGLSVNTATGLISGTPTAAGSFNVGLRAANAEGAGTATLVLAVLPPVVHSFNLETDPGWTRQGEWAYGTPAGGGGSPYGRPDPTSGATGTKVFGINLAGNYSTTQGTAQYLTTGPLNLLGRTGVTLRFKRWLNADYQPYTTQTIQVSRNGSTWTTVWQNGTSEIADNAWTTVSYDISAVADDQPAVYLRWGHQITSGGAWAYSGWNLDDVEVLGAASTRLTLTLPATVQEGAEPVTGTVTAFPVPASDLLVTLSTTNGTRLALPPSATIPAGQASATFTLGSAVDNLLNGSPLVEVRATAPDYGDGTASTRVVDAQSAVLTVTLPAEGFEGAEDLTGMVSVSAPVSVDVAVALLSSDSTELDTPVEVVIPAGNSGAEFPLTLLDDSAVDGDQTVSLTAQVAGWTPGSATMRVLDTGVPEFYTEVFDGPGAGDENDTAGFTYTFTPKAGRYTSSRQPAADFPTSPAGGSPLVLSDDSFQTVTLEGDATVALFGISHASLHVGSNGYVTFGVGDNSLTGSLSNHFSKPRVAALMTDLNPSNQGTVSWRQLEDRVAVTWQNIREYGTTNRNDFQIELYFDGRIAITILHLDALEGLIGLSAGQGVPLDFVESDFSSYPMPTLELELPAAAMEGDGQVTGLVRLDIPMAEDTQVQVASGNPAEVLVPATVTIPAGLTEAELPVTVVDDELLDGTQEAVLTVNVPGYPEATATLRVHDNESTTLSLTLPAAVTEGAAPAQGTVALASPAGRAVRVELGTDLPDRLGLPDHVIVPAGQSSATFPLQVVDNDLLEGSGSAQVTAYVEGWTGAEAGLEMRDDENTPMLLALPEEMVEGETVEGRLILGGVAAQEFFVELSHESTRLSVDGMVYVPVGASEAVFFISAVDIGPGEEEDELVTLSAQAEGLEGGLGQLRIVDGTLVELALSPVPPAQQAGVPFPLTVTAKGRAGRLLRGFSGPLSLTAAGAEGPVPLHTLGSGEFVQGVWSGQVVMEGLGSQVVLRAEAAGVECFSSPFGVAHGPLHHFDWQLAAGQKVQDEPFAATVTARDRFGHLVSSHSGGFTLSAHTGGSTGPVRVLAYTGFADMEEGYPRMVQAVAAHFPGFELETLAGLPNDSTLAAALAGKDVFLVPEQPRASLPTLAGLGTSWALPLAAFVNAGGTLVVCSHQAYEHLIPQGAGLISATKTGVLLPSTQLRVLSKSVLTAGLADSFTARNLAPWSDSNGQAVLLRANGQPVVLRRDVGQGRVVIIGTTFANASPELERVAANAVALARLELPRLAATPHAVPAMVGGSWTGQVRMRQAAAQAYLRATAGMVLGESAAFSVQQAHGGPALIALMEDGQVLENGASTLSAGTSTIGTASAGVALTLRNVTPATTLNLGAMTLTGAHAAEFTLDRTATAASLAGGVETSVVVRFTPRAAGARTAQLSIASNSTVDQPLVLSLEGTGAPAAGPGQQIVADDTGPRRPTDGAFDLNAYSTSGLPLAYEVLTGPATVDAAGRVTPTGANGAVTLRISQPGGGGYDGVERFVTFALGSWPRFVRVFGGQNTYATFAIHENGTLWSWGYVNATGYLGDTTALARITPTQIGTATNWTDVAVGNGHALGRRSDGTLWAWGSNTSGQLGDGTTTTRSAPIQVGLGRSWLRVAAGSSHSAAIATDGTLWTWGLNSSSQLGDGTTTLRSSPTQIGSATNWSQVACGGSFTVALRADGTLWAWGLNSSGQLGMGDTTTRTAPVQVGTATDWQAVACGSNYVLAQKTTGELWAWGSGASGQLGNGSTTTQNLPVQVSADRDWVSFSCGSFTSVARKQDGSLWCWGANTAGQLGDGTTTNRPLPQRFATGTAWADICASQDLGCITALRSDGQLWVAGEALGLSGLSPRSLSWGADTDGAEWTDLSGNGTHFTALRADGTLWAWGQNGNSQLGDGGSSFRSVLTQIGTDNQWAQVAAGSHNIFSNATMAVKKNGTLWGWGTNTSYQLGDGSTTNRSSPVQIGTATDWKQVACGQVYGMGVRMGGTLWGWGTNGSSQLGNGGTATQTAPVQIGAVSTWSAVSCGIAHSAGLRYDGTLWIWGLNSSGQLGLGDTTNRTGPVQVGTATDWVAVACGGSHTLALKSNGTLWAWGLNSSGQLGLGDTTNRTSPVQVGTATDWARISASRNASCALATTGALWTSGENHSGQMGNGGLTARSTLTLVSAAGFQRACVGAMNLAAIRGDGSFWTAGAAGARVLAGGRSRTTVSPVLPALSAQAMLTPNSSYMAWQAPIRLHGTSGLPAQLRVLSGPAMVGAGGASLIPTGTGTVTVLAWQPGDERAWDAAPPEQVSFSIGNDFTSPLPADGTPLVSLPSFDASAVSLNLTLNFAPANGQVFTLVENTGSGAVRGEFTGLAMPGWVVLTYQGVAYGFRVNYAGGDGNDITLTHQVAPQAIFGGNIPAKAATDPAFDPGATSTSGLPVQYAVLSGPASVSGGQVVLTGAEGVVTLRLTQPGNARFLAAAPVTRVFRVTQGLFRFTAVSTSRTGSHTLALMGDGSLWAWGLGTSGQVGDGSFTSRFLPLRVGTAQDWQQVSAGGSHSAGIRAGGALWTWGSNSSGQLGDGTTISRTSPVQVAGSWARVSAGSLHTAAVRVDGSLWAWGYNFSGQLGDGSTASRSSPVRVGTDSNWASVSCGPDFTLALKTNGTLWAWGNNAYGQLGNGTSTNQTTPVQIGTSTQWKSASAGGFHAVAVRLDGTLWTWGWGGWGSLGLGNTANRNIPVRVGTGSGWQEADAGYGHTMARHADGSLWTCGLNNNAQLGLGDQAQRQLLERTAPGGPWVAVSSGATMTYALALDGTLHAWGDGGGYHGLSARSLTRSQPPMAGGWAQVSLSGAHTMLRTPDGRLWAQGLNTSGQLGMGDTQSRDLAQLGVLDDWTQVSAGGSHTLALREDGSLWAWGANGNGQIGDGTNSNRQVPVRIGTDSDWAYVCAATNHSLAVKNNGTLWAWGLNLNSQLGDGTTTSSTSPVQVAGTGWVAVAGGSVHSLGLKSDGTLWAWGFNGNGQVGDGTTTSRSTPTQIAFGSGGWTAVRAGGSFSAALRQDGTLWTWGQNTDGQLGSGGTTNRTSPGQVGVAVDWMDVSCGTNSMAGVRQDGSLWVWGGGAAGQLGEGNRANVLNPRRVGNGTGWVAAQAGENCLAAVHEDGSLWTAGFTGGQRLGPVAGRSLFAIAPVLPALFPQVLEEVPEGGGVRVTASSGLPVSFFIISGQATVQDGLVLPAGPPGSVARVLAWQPGDDSAWDAALPVELTLTAPAGQVRLLAGGPDGVEIARGTGHVDFGMTDPATPVLRSFTVVNSGASTLSLGRLGVSSVVGWQVQGQGMAATLAPGQSTSFTVAFQAALAGLSEATVSLESDEPGGLFTFQVRGVSRVAQGIVFEDIPEQECGTPLDLSGLVAASSGQPVGLAVVAGGDVASLSGRVLTFLKAGAVTLRATQPGAGLYAAVAASHVIQVRRGQQVLSFAPGLPTSISHRGSVGLAAASSRGLVPVAFRVLDGPGVLSGSSLGFTGPGPVVLEASQAGDDAFLPATAETVIVATNAAPVALVQSLQTPDGAALPITLGALDGDGDALVFTVVTPPAHGTLTGSQAARIYMSENGYAGPDSFTFQVSDGFETSAVARVDILVTPVAPAFPVAPQPLAVNPGARAVLAVPYTGSRPLIFQWWKGAQLLEGKAQDTLVIDPAAEGDEGDYRLVITNDLGTQTSAPLSFSVNDPVEFTTHPLSQAVGELDTLVLTAATTGTAPITYRWFHEGAPLAATGDTLTLAGITAAQAGAYHVVATNPVGDFPSDVAEIEVIGTTPRITRQPAHQMVPGGGLMSLDVQALGRLPLRYQWKLNGKNITGATGPRLEWHNAGLPQAGKYTVQVSTSGGFMLSDVAEVGVVVNQPARLTLAENGGTTLRVQSAGNSLAHVWTRVDAALPPLSRAKPSTDGKSLVFTKAQSEDSGTYVCQVTGPGGSLPGGTVTLAVFDSPPGLEDDQEMPPAIVGGLFTHQIRLAGGGEAAASSYKVQNLPPGLKVNATTGLISGRPTKEGTREVTITVSNKHGNDEVKATLEVKPFPTGLTGGHTGIVARDTVLTLGLGGRLDLTLTSQGSVSGKLTLGSLPAYKLTGALTLDATEAAPPRLLLTIPRAGKPTPAPLVLELTFDTAQGITAPGSRVMALEDEVADIQAWRTPWQARDNPCRYPGFHTFALEPPEEQLTDLTVPHGHGHGSFTVAAAGTATISGKTADGQGFTSASPMGGQGQLAVFSLLYPAPGRGSLRGVIQVSGGVSADTATDNLVDGALDWSRPDKRPKGGVLYPAGFGPVPLTAVGGAYVAAARHLGLPAGVNIAGITFTGGGIESSQTNPDTGITIDYLNRIFPETPNLGNLTLTSKTTAATFSGVFHLNDPHWQKPAPARWPRKVPYQGLIIHRAGLYWGAGYYLLPALPTADPAKSPPPQFSGRVLWQRNTP